MVRNRLRVRRPQEWLLLLLRTLAILGLVLLFLQPRLFTQRRLAGLQLQRHVVVVLDSTASMNALDGAQTRFAQAAAEASEVLNGLRSGDTANLIWLRRVPAPVFPEPGANIPALLDDLRRQTCSLEAGDIRAAFALARSQLHGLEGAREICLVSDFQASAWQGITLDAGDDASVLLLRVGSGEGENAAVSGLRTVPAQPLLGETVEFQCEVRNYAPTAQQRSVQFAFGEARQSQDVSIPAWGAATVLFRQKATEPGTQAVRVSLAPDRFPADDELWDLLDVREKVPVAVVGANPRTAAVWQRCLNALGWVDVLPIESLAAPLRETPQLAVVTGWDGAIAPQSGDLTGVPRVLEPARDVRASAPTELAAVWEQPREPLALTLALPGHALFRAFTEGDYGSPAAGTVLARHRFADPARWSALLAYADGQPALASPPGDETTWLWNIPLESEFGNYAAQPQFVALVGEILQLARANAAPPARPASECGDALLLQTDAPLDATDVQLSDSRGGSLPLLPTRSATGAFVSQPARMPGLYTWSADRHTLGSGVVRFPAAESDLRRLDPTRVSPDAVPLAGGGSVRSMRTGHRLWPLFLLLCLGLLLTEGFVLRWMDNSSTR
jgi:hypothetical protein